MSLYRCGVLQDRRAKKFRLEDMTLHNGMTFDTIVQQFVKSENIHFWSFKDDSNNTIQLPAILLTDTCKWPLSSSLYISPFTCFSCRPQRYLINQEAKHGYCDV